jgi:hypothetical protein
VTAFENPELSEPIPLEVMRPDVIRRAQGVVAARLGDPEAVAEVLDILGIRDRYYPLTEGAPA